jgi:chemotaxis protein MotB
LFDATNPLNPINRRISIIVMNKRTEEAVSKDGGTIEPETKEPDAKEEVPGEQTDAAAAKP